MVWLFERLSHVQRRIQMMSINLEKNHRGVIILNYPHRRYFDPQFLLVFNNLKCILGHIHKQKILTLSDWDCRFQNHRCMAAYQENTILFIISCYVMMTSSNGNTFRVTGLLCGEFLTNTSDVELWCFLWSAPEQTVEQTIKTLVIWDAIALIMA